MTRSYCLYALAKRCRERIACTVLCCVLYMVNLLNSLVGGAEKVKERDDTVPRADKSGDRTAV